MDMKEEVINALSLRNTVGQEVIEIMQAHGIADADIQLGINNLATREKLTDRQIAKVCALLDMGDVLRNFLKDFQAKYFSDKPRIMEAYHTSKKNFTKLKAVLPLLRDEFNQGEDQLDDILDFFGVDSEDAVFTSSEQAAALFRKQNRGSVNPINLKAWLRRGELDFAKMRIPTYSKKALTEWIETKEWMNYLESPEYFKQLPVIFATMGVGMVLVPYLPNTVYGAVRWINGLPLVEISDRNQDLATCWITLFHELGHVLLHNEMEILEGDINDSNCFINKQEREANNFASRWLFGGDALRQTVFDRKRNGISMTSKELSDEFEVNPLFTAYWLLKAQVNPTFQRRIHIDFVDSYQA